MPTSPTPAADRPADQLRAAAEKLRAAAAAVPSDDWGTRAWHVEECSDTDTMESCPCIVAQGEHKEFDQPQVPLIQYVADAETTEHAAWIALMHPGVGLVVAAWLDAAAEYYTPGPTHPTHVVHALAVARQLLGTSEAEGAPSSVGTSASRTNTPGPSVAATLATPCDACDHTLNWHRNDVGCTVPRCVCGRFQDPVEPAAADAQTASYWQQKLSAVTEGRDHLRQENERLRKELVQSERIRENADFHLGQEMARRQLAEKAAAPPAPADRAATRDRIRRAICEASGFTWLPDELVEPDEYGEHADAVLAVLADRAAAGVQPPTTNEAESCSTTAHLPHRWAPQPGMPPVPCPGTPAASAAPEETQ
ncbi:hypothetical protein [Streptomyces anulatus]|uniref:hypothetical protein n=1 Tax=Streptomyces anulatus TaxID=1892 RepID=UPI00366450EB